MTTTTDDNSAGVAVLGGAVLVLGFCALVLVMSVWGGFVLQQLWNWYGAPLTNVRLGLAQAIGLSTLLSIVRGYRHTKKGESDSGGAIFGVLIFTAISLLVGWAAHFYL